MNSNYFRDTNCFYGFTIRSACVIFSAITYIFVTVGHSTAIVAYANDIEAAENLKEQLLAVDDIEQVLIMPLGPVISTHVGPDTLAVFTIGKEVR